MSIVGPFKKMYSWHHIFFVLNYSVFHVLQICKFPFILFCKFLFFYVDIHCVKSVRIRSYSVQMRENKEQNNSKYGHFFTQWYLRTVRLLKIWQKWRERIIQLNKLLIFWCNWITSLVIKQKMFLRAVIITNLTTLK